MSAVRGKIFLPECGKAMAIPRGKCYTVSKVEKTAADA